MFIAFDGIDGAGKSTQVEILANNLKMQRMDVKIYDMGKEGFLDEIFLGIKNKNLSCSSEIREMLYYFEGILFGEHIKDQRKKCNKRIEVVDRYMLSFLSYGPLNGVKNETISRIISRMPWPDIYFYIDILPESTLERIKKYRDIDLPEIGYKNALSNDKSTNDQNFLIYQTQVRKNYINAIECLRKKGNTVVVLDGTLPTIDIEKIILKEVNSWIKQECNFVGL
ncbi:MAG: hypothetical protein NC251_10830 [Lachnoclostridium sp.]|nr:hypothetical protein [Lachnospira sp.]MCM1248914.1 hypothetical protein [Lachnoclostridium sp.]